MYSPSFMSIFLVPGLKSDLFSKPNRIRREADDARRASGLRCHPTDPPASCSSRSPSWIQLLLSGRSWNSSDAVLLHSDDPNEWNGIRLSVEFLHIFSGNFLRQCNMSSEHF